MNKTKILKVDFVGGLCNKLFDLFAICDIAIKNKIQIADPLFGWPKKDVYFSEIYDLDFFNKEMRKFNNNEDIIISKDDFSNYEIINNNQYKLGEYSQNILRNQREKYNMNKECMNIIVLKYLKLNSKYDYILDKYNMGKTAFHIRIENDWRQYATYKKVPKNETLLIDVRKLFRMFRKSEINENNIFFTIGMAHENLSSFLKSNNFSPEYFFDKNYKYEVNAAINFELCCRAKNFVGISRSTFSNLVTLKRYILGNDNSYIYNYRDSIRKREDKGLHCEAEKSIKNVNII